MKIDFPAINDALRNFWQALEPFAESVGTGLIKFFGDLLSIGADFINAVVPNALNGIAKTLKSIKPETAEKIGYALGIVGIALTGMKLVVSTITGIAALGNSFITLKAGLTGVAELIGTVTGFFGKLTVLGGMATTIAGIGSVIGGTTLSVTNFFNMWKNGFDWLNEALMILALLLPVLEQLF